MHRAIMNRILYAGGKEDYSLSQKHLYLTKLMSYN
jgi:hypothetical protein